MVFGNYPPRIIGLKPANGHKSQSLAFKRKSPNSALFKKRKQRGRSPTIEEDEILG
jgi:hypothetical protein